MGFFHKISLPDELHVQYSRTLFFFFFLITRNEMCCSDDGSSIPKNINSIRKKDNGLDVCGFMVLYVLHRSVLWGRT